MKCKYCCNPMKRIHKTNIYVCTCPIEVNKGKIIRCDCYSCGRVH